MTRSNLNAPCLLSGVILVTAMCGLLVLAVLVCRRHRRTGAACGRSEWSPSTAVRPPPESASPEARPSVSACIVEPRDHPKLDYVIKNVADTLGPAVPIHLWHGRSMQVCADVDSTMCRLQHAGRLTTHRLDVDNLDWRSYSQLLSSRRFWDVQTSDKTLIFQTDSVLCSRSPETLAAFVHLDYVGSRAHDDWDWIANGGNGGLSLRDTRLSRECSTETGSTEAEDVMFVRCIAQRGGRMATRAEQERFGTQNYFARDSLGAHQVNTQLVSNRNSFRVYCPEYTDDMK